MSILDNLRRMMLMQSGSTNREMGIMNRQNTGGLMNNNQPQQIGGLFGNLSNINPNLLIGASIAGSGLRGIDPFSSVLPALTETAQLQKYLTPEREKLMTAYDPKKKKRVFATRTEIEQKGLEPVPESPELTADQRNFAAYKNIMETGTETEKNIAKQIFTSGGRSVKSKEEFLIGIANELSKDITKSPEDIQASLPQYESIYDKIISPIDTQEVTPPTMEEKVPEGFKGTLDEWKKVKQSNPNVADQQLINWYNSNYGG